MWLITFVSLYANNYDVYFGYAGKKYNINPNLLKAIAIYESNINPKVVHKNKNGTYDIGIMQINTVHKETLKRYGISLHDLFKPSTNIIVGAWVLSECFKKFGYTEQAIGCYNGGSKNFKYARKILFIFENLKKGNNNESNL